MLNDLDKDIWFAIISGSLLLFILCAFIVAFTMLYIKKRRQHKTEKKELQVEFAQTLLQSQLEIKEQTLQHLADELHDNLGQIASLIKINLNTINLEDESKSHEKIEDTKSLLRHLIKDLKLLSVNLNGDRVAQLGIVTGLETEVEHLNKSGQFKAVLNHQGENPNLDHQKSIILFRMAQEIINNIIKHSKAKHVSISIHVSDKLLTLEFVDDGVGFSVDEAMKKGGSGLISLQNRAKLINSKLLLTSSSEDGTRTSIVMML